MSDKKKQTIIAVIRKYMCMRGYDSIKALSHDMRFSYTMLKRRMKDAGVFTVDELNRVVRFLKIPADELPEWG